MSDEARKIQESVLHPDDTVTTRRVMAVQRDEWIRVRYVTRAFLYFLAVAVMTSQAADSTERGWILLYLALTLIAAVSCLQELIAGFLAWKRWDDGDLSLWVRPSRSRAR